MLAKFMNATNDIVSTVNAIEVGEQLDGVQLTF